MCNLSDAYKGFPLNLRLKDVGREVYQSITKDYPEITSIQPGALSSVPNVQARMYSSLVKHRFPDMVDDTIVRRVGKLFHPYVLPDFAPHLPETRRMLRNLRGHDAIRVLKTWCNGWCTSRRFQEKPVLPCFFSCPIGEDSLEHYLQCPQLYALLKFFFSNSASNPVHLKEEPHMRIALYNPSYDELKIVACTFSAYHAMKNRFRHSFSAGGSLVPGEPLPPHMHSTFLEVFAETFSTEAAELRLETRSFNFQAFSAFAYGPIAAIVDG